MIETPQTVWFWTTIFSTLFAVWLWFENRFLHKCLSDEIGRTIQLLNELDD